MEEKFCAARNQFIGALENRYGKKEAAWRKSGQEDRCCRAFFKKVR
jgi:hypothetical protein